jgi:hypothetical protein
VADEYQLLTQPLRKFLSMAVTGLTAENYDIAKKLVGPLTFTQDHKLLDQFGYVVSKSYFAEHFAAATKIDPKVSATLLLVDTQTNEAVYTFRDSKGNEVTKLVIAASKTAESKKPSLAMFPKSVTVNINRPDEKPYKEPSDLFKCSDKDKAKLANFQTLVQKPQGTGKYLWVLREDGEIWIAPESQPGRSGKDSERLVKHRDMTLSASDNGMTVKAGRMGGELKFNPTLKLWVMNADSSYSYSSSRNDMEDCQSVDKLRLVQSLLYYYGCVDADKIVVTTERLSPD